MTIQPINYVDYDFETLVSQLQSRLALKDAWKDMYKSSTGSMLIELFSAVGTLVLYYIERRAEESYINTAQLKSSVINLVRLLNYIPARNVSSIGTLRFSLSAAATEMVFIPKYTECATAGGYKFLVSTEGVIMPGQTYVDVPGVQGGEKNISFVSTGSTSQEYAINDTKIENSSTVIVLVSGISLSLAETFTTLEVVIDSVLQLAFPNSYYVLNTFGTYDVYAFSDLNRPITLDVQVNGVSWTQKTSFINSTNISTDYVIRPELDDTLTIIFGNNVFGKAPVNGETVTVIYVQSDGVLGNVYSTDLITTLNSTIYDVNSVIQTVTVANTTNFLGGDDLQTIEEIREAAPQVFATGDRLVTKADYIAVLNSYPGVADSNVWGEAEETSPDVDYYNQVQIVAIMENWVLPDTAFKSTLSAYLYTRSLMTVRYTYVAPEILYVIPTLVIKVLSGYQLSAVQSEVETDVSALFTLGTASKLGKSVRESDVTATIDGIDGVSYSHLTLKLQKELSDTYDSTYDWSETMEAVPLLATGVEIYIDDTCIAIDDGAAGWTDLGSTYTVTGDVTYATGVVNVDITPAPGPSEVVYCRYQQNQSGDIVVTKAQICKWSENDYTSIAYVT